MVSHLLSAAALDALYGFSAARAGHTVIRCMFIDSLQQKLYAGLRVKAHSETSCLVTRARRLTYDVETLNYMHLSSSHLLSAAALGTMCGVNAARAGHAVARETFVDSLQLKLHADLRVEAHIETHCLVARAPSPCV